METSNLMKEIRDSSVLMCNAPLWPRLTALIEDCYLPPLSKPSDEYQKFSLEELEYFFITIDKKMLNVIELLRNLEGRIDRSSMNNDFIASIVLLLYEMKPGPPWSKVKNYARYLEIISSLFRTTFSFDACARFPDESDFQDFSSIIFVTCMEKLHKKLTKDMWKRQPAALHSFRLMTNLWTEIHQVKCPLPLIFPGIFLQIDDYEDNNKIEGLKCCKSILKNVKNVATDDNGYEIVIYDSLIKYIKYRETPLVNGALGCMMFLLPAMTKPQNQWSQIDDVYEQILDALATESKNENRKLYWKYLVQLIRINCNCAIRWKQKFFLLIIEHLDLYLSDPGSKYADIKEILSCLETWLRVGWPVWKFSTDRNMIFTIYKIIYHRKEQKSIEMRCLLLMLSLCTEEQRKQLFSEEYVKISIFDKQFQQLWSAVVACETSMQPKT